jgi:folate-binding protein YgfZ
MPDASPATRLTSRAVIRLAPLDADENVRDFLQGLVTNDVCGALPVWAALLTPQGKVLWDFIVWPDETGEGLLIDCEAEQADALAKRLSLYRLRRKIAITRDTSFAVHWSTDGPGNDPRLAALGHRWLASAAEQAQGGTAADRQWLAHRLRLGVPEGRAELGDGELLWLECNAAELNGVSFTKGCYVGQENTARMNWRQKVNRRLLVVPLDRSDPARRRCDWADLGLALDHLRVEAIDAAIRPAWLVADPA